MANYEIDLYRIDVANSSLYKLDNITSYQALSYRNELNGIGACVFSLNVFDTKSVLSNFAKYITQVAVKRNGSIVWFGTISENPEFDLYGVNGTLTISATGWHTHFLTRYTEQVYNYETEDIGDIVGTLITDAQNRTNGALVTSVASHDPIQNVDRTYYEDNSIGDIILDEHDNLASFDFRYTHTVDGNGDWNGVQFEVYKGLGSKRDDLNTLTIGDGGNVNRLRGIGIGDGSNTIKAKGFGVGENTVTQEYSISGLQTGYTRKEKILKLWNVSTESTLLEKATEYVRYNTGNRYDIQVELVDGVNPKLGQFSLGDTLNVDLVVPNTFINFQGTARIRAINIDVDDQGHETIYPNIIYN